MILAEINIITPVPPAVSQNRYGVKSITKGIKPYVSKLVDQDFLEPMKVCLVGNVREINYETG